jgi:CRISPR-associated protein Cas2
LPAGKPWAQGYVVMTMDVVITYDVETQTEDSERRLRRVATICQNYGQRVQKSVFECRVDQAQLEQLEASLLKVIDARRDSLRVYILRGGREQSVRVHGVDRYVDFDAPPLT